LFFTLLTISLRAQKINMPEKGPGGSFPAIRTRIIPLPPLATIPASWYTDNLAGMCLPEWKLQKTTGIPLRLRLGSLDYVNHLEGKR
jgi:hypothetical protein